MNMVPDPIEEPEAYKAKTPPCNFDRLYFCNLIIIWYGWIMIKAWRLAHDTVDEVLPLIESNLDHLLSNLVDKVQNAEVNRRC